METPVFRCALCGADATLGGYTEDSETLLCLDHLEAYREQDQTLSDEEILDLIRP